MNSGPLTASRTAAVAMAMISVVSIDRAHFRQPAQHRDGTGHRLFLKAVVGESAFAEPDHVLDLIQDRRGSVRMDADEQQADRVAAEIDDADGFFRPL